jgi:hypothetical protein
VCTRESRQRKKMFSFTIALHQCPLKSKHSSVSFIILFYTKIYCFIFHLNYLVEKLRLVQRLANFLGQGPFEKKSDNSSHILNKQEHNMTFLHDAFLDYIKHIFVGPAWPAGCTLPTPGIVS